MRDIVFSAVLFDMDGVLIQSREVIEYAWTSVAKKNGIELSDEYADEFIHGRLGSYTLDAIFKNFSEEEKHDIKRQVDDIEETAKYDLVPGVFKLLNLFRVSQVPLALVTSSWSAKIDNVIQDHGLGSVFATIIDRDDVIHGKPDPACYRLAAKRLGVDIRQCLIFEDSQSGVKAAVQSGASCIGIGHDPTLKSCGAKAAFSNFCHLLSPRFGGNRHYIDLSDETSPLVLANASGSNIG